MSVTRIPNHLDNARALLPDQHRDQVDYSTPGSWLKILRAIIGEINFDQHAAISYSFSIAPALYPPGTTVTYSIVHPQLGAMDVVYTVPAGPGQNQDQLATSLAAGIQTQPTIFPYTTASNPTANSIEINTLDVIFNAVTGSVPGMIVGFASTERSRLQEIEEVLVDVLLLRTLALARGTQLDKIGVIVGIARTSSDDEVYRNDIRAQIVVNVSSGTPEEILDAARSFDGVLLAQILEFFPASFELFIYGVELTTTQIDLLLSMKGAGIGMYLISSGTEFPLVFGADRDAAAGTHGVDDPDGFGLGEGLPIAAYTINVDFTVKKDVTPALGVGDRLMLVPGNGNPTALLTVATIVYSAGPDETVITVNETWVDPGADSQLELQEDIGAFSEVYH